MSKWVLGIYLDNIRYFIDQTINQSIEKRTVSCSLLFYTHFQVPNKVFWRTVIGSTPQLNSIKLLHNCCTTGLQVTSYAKPPFLVTLIFCGLNGRLVKDNSFPLWKTAAAVTWLVTTASNCEFSQQNLIIKTFKQRIYLAILC